MVKYCKPGIDYKRRRKSVAVPDQSLSIQKIVERYVKGIPVDVVQRQAVFVDQNDHDLEKLSRMDFGEKAEYAQAMAAEAKRLETEHNEAVRRVQEERAQGAKEAAEKAEAARKASGASKGMQEGDFARMP